MLEGWKLEVFMVVLPYLVPVIVLGLVMLLVAVRNKIENEKVQQVLDSLVTILAESVRQVGKPLVEKIKEKSADGKLTYDDAKQVRQEVVEDTKLKAEKLLDEQCKKVMQKIEGLDKKLEEKIEDILANRK